MPTAVASAEARNGDETPDAAFAHSVDEDARGLREEGRAAEDRLRTLGRPQRLDHRIGARHGRRDAGPVERIAGDLLQRGDI